MTNHKSDHTALTASPSAEESAELSDEQLDHVAGGFTPVPIPERLAEPGLLTTIRKPSIVSGTVGATSLATVVKDALDGHGGMG